jgi:hypothetical protein
MPVNPAPQTPVERSLVITPPVKGWNTRDPKSNMDPEYALALENFFPGNGVVSLRNGYTVFADGANTSCETLATLEYGTGVSKLVGVGGIGGNWRPFDITAGTITDISGGVNFFAPQCATLQFQDRLFIKVGVSAGVASDVYHWTGTGNIAASNFTGPGGDDKDLLAIGSYKNRLYFSQYTAPSIWYGGLYSITGALTEFPIGGILQKGFTYILFVGTTVRAKQYAEEELLCIVTDKGEVLLYGGSYPGSADWNLVGRYTIPTPVGTRAFFYSGSDLNIVTRNGVMSVQKMIRGDYAGTWPSLSEVVESAFISAYSVNFFDFSNVGIAYPKGQYILANYYTGSVWQQLIMNVVSGAWTKFTNQNAKMWAVWQDSLYFGDVNGVIYKADNGFYDESAATPGTALTRTIKLRHAFNYFGDPSLRKKFITAQPTMYQSEGMDITADMDVDYTDTTATSAETDTSKGTSYQIYQPKLKLVGPSGNAGSFRIDGSVSTKRFSLEATKIIWSEGGIE